MICKERSRVWFRPAVALVVLVALAGCSTDDPGGSATATSASTSEPTRPEPSPSTAAATGPRLVASDLDVEVVSVRLPDDGDWKVSGGRLAGNLFTDDDGGFWRIDVSTVLAFDTTDPDELADIGLDSYQGESPRVRRAEDRTVQGVDGYVLEGTGSEGLRYEFGALRGEVGMSVKFDLPKDNAKTRELIESVLASLKWECEPSACRGE